MQARTSRRIRFPKTRLPVTARGASSVLLVLLLSTLLTACGDGITDAREESTARLVAGGLLLDVEVDRATMVVGDTLWIRVAISNPSAEPVALTRSWGCALDIRIEDRAGKAVRPERTCRSTAFEVVVEPGGRVERDFAWTAERVLHDPFVKVGLPGGRYSVVAVLAGPTPETSGSRTVRLRYPPD